MTNTNTSDSGLDQIDDFRFAILCLEEAISPLPDEKRLIFWAWIWRQGSAGEQGPAARVDLYFLIADVTVSCHSGHSTRGCIPRLKAGVCLSTATRQEILQPCNHAPQLHSQALQPDEQPLNHFISIDNRQPIKSKPRHSNSAPRT